MAALFRHVIAIYGYPRIAERVDGIFERKEEAERYMEQAEGMLIENTIGLGWAKYWRVVRAEIEEHDEMHGAVVAGCVPVEEQG